MIKLPAKLTESWIEARQRNPPPNVVDLSVPEHGGLVIRIHPSGVVSFRFRYVKAGRRSVVSMGVFGLNGGMTLAKAKADAAIKRRELVDRLDPIEEHEKREKASQLRRDASAAAPTVGYLIEQFCRRRLRGERWDAATREWARDPKAKSKPRKRPADAEALLGYRHPDTAPRRRHKSRKPVASVMSRLGPLLARDVTKRQLIELFDAIVNRGSPVTANRVYSLTKQMFDWGASRDLIPASPMAGIDANPGGKERSRPRSLSDKELCTVWFKLDECQMSPRVRRALRLLMVLAQRRIELVSMLYSKIDFETSTWEQPGNVTKNGVPHLVPLPKLALDLISQIRSDAEARAAKRGEPISDYVFPNAHSRRKKHGHLTQRALTRAIAENESVFGIPHFRPHDFRRTFRTWAPRAKISRDVAERVINHLPAKLARTYDLYEYLDEKRDALERYATHIETLIASTDSNVVLFEPSKQARRA